MSNVYKDSGCTKFAQDRPIGIADVPADINHAISNTHKCNGKHIKEDGVTKHFCDCGAKFFMLDEAIDMLVKWYGSLHSD